ncbi:hypothetical protein [Halovivax cerinus]|uniref:Uncharacterized protein n=1 Tax=Halovivax cerinus TaxID=1487865 RepID=A0ABD5NL95_9EURY|nr:hypothetical protein [Halovivax cerinus]
MTGANPTDPRDGETGDTGGHENRSSLASGSLERAAGRLVRDPVTLLPFAIVGVLLTGIDALRRRDPIPSVEWATVADRTIHVEYSLYPGPRSHTIRPFVALIDLDVPYLLWAVGLELLATGAMVIAGVVVIRRALAERGVDVPSVRDRVGAYLGFVVAVDVLARFVGGIGIFRAMPLVIGVPVLIVAAVVGVRLFLVPASLVAGRSLPSAIGHSNQLSFGHGWSFLGLILVFGLGTWLLASVPAVGTILSGLVVAPLQAVTLAVVYERVSRGSGETSHAAG